MQTTEQQSQQRLDKVQKGDRLKASTINGLIDAVSPNIRRANPLPARRIENEIRWEITRYDDTSIKVGSGIWTRRGVVMSYTPGETADITGLNSNGDYYIYAQLANASKDPALIPNVISVEKSTVDTYPSDDIGNRKLVLGKATVASNVISAIEQYVLTDVDDFVCIPDTNSKNSSTKPYLSTIEERPTSDIHEKELQLFDADSVGSSRYAFPLLDKDSDSNGQLEWVAFDTDVGGYNAGSNKSIQRISDSSNVIQVYGFSTASSTNPTSSDLFLFKSSSQVKYASLESMANAISDIFDANNSWGTPHDVGAIDHGELAGLADDDHTQYWIVDGSYSRNYGMDIGNHAKNKVIDLGSEQLIDALTTTATIDWANCELNTTGGKTVVDWNDKKLIDVSTKDSVNWQSRVLVDANGTVASVDWQARDLVNSSGDNVIDWEQRWANNVWSFTSTTDSTAITNGAITVLGGVGVGKNLVVGSNVSAQSFTASGNNGFTGTIDVANATAITVVGGIITGVTY